MIFPLLGPLVFVLSGALGVDNRFQTDPTQVKCLEAGLEKRLALADFKTSAGYWWDATHYPGAKDSAYVSESMTVGPHFKIFDVGATFGVAYVNRPDVVLGSHFEFVPGAEIMVKDSRGVEMGAYFEHFSDAGLTKVNEGRNFLGVRIKL